MHRLTLAAFGGIMVLIAGVFTAEARPEYARRENKPCAYCHLNPGGGGPRGFRGQFYGANNLSFEKFDEKREASIAGVAPESAGPEGEPHVAYVGAVSGDAATGWRQIQLAANRTGGVIAIFLDSTSDVAKSAANLLHRLAMGYGGKATIVGVTNGDVDKALKLTQDLGAQIRVLPDPSGSTVKKFGASQGLDIVVVSKMGSQFRLISGYSKGNLETAIAQLGVYGVAAPNGIGLEDAPASPVHGAKLGG